MNKKPLSVVLVDDETSAISNLTHLIEAYCEGVRIAGTAGNSTEGIRVIQETSPDLVFLDIEMPGGNGFDLLECFPRRSFDVIFVTSYNQHAIKAFRYSAVDYLLKPVDIDNLMQSVDRVLQQRQRGITGDSLTGLYANLHLPVPVKLGVATTEGKIYLDIQEIIRIEADGSYSTIYLKNGHKQLVSRNIGEYEELLEDQHFLRVHNSHLINLLAVSRYTKQDGGWIIMNDRSEIPLSRRRKELFESLMKTISRE